MDHNWMRFWWLIFPLMWFVFGILRMLLCHRHRRDTLELLRTYATQGRELPPELVKVLQNGDSLGWRRSRGPYRL